MDNLSAEEGYAVVIDGKKNMEYIKLKNLEISPGYALIEVKSAGIGPYDLYFTDGIYKLKLEENLKHVGGCEGAGIVRKVGSETEKNLLNKNVAFLLDYNDEKSRGSWSQFAVVPTNFVFEIDQENPDFDHAAYTIANPLTALGIKYDLLSGKKILMQDCASGSLGKMIAKICVKEGIEIINICRKESSIANLKEIGCKYNLSSDSKSFFDDLKNLIKELNPMFFISCSGGNFPSRVFEIMPDGSEMCALGNMSLEQLNGFTSQDFIFRDKTLSGWNIFNSMEKTGVKKYSEELNKIIKSKDKTFETVISKSFKLSEIKEAVKYYVSNMSEGKVVLNP